MANKKFELTSETINLLGITLFRIKALVDFGNVKSGDLGGFVEKEENLSMYGDAWVYGNARVCGDSLVCGNARVYGDSLVCGNARVCGDSLVCGNARVCGDSLVCGDAWVYGNARVCGDSLVCGNARVCGDSLVCGNARVYGDSLVCGNARVCGDAWVYGDADYATIKGFGTVFRTTTFFRCKDKRIRVTCGCFYGTINQFRKQVKKTRKDKIAKEYLMIADLMEEHFK